jgi:biopolymer transport protein ExbB
VIREAILDAANLETPLLEKHLSTLGTVAYIAPLLGLLGTVTGNIRAFGVLAGFESVGDPTLLAKGISEALLTTAAGIIVSIPTVIFYNAFVSRVNHAIVRLETRVNALIRLLGVEGSD